MLAAFVGDYGGWPVFVIGAVFLAGAAAAAFFPQLVAANVGNVDLQAILRGGNPLTKALGKWRSLKNWLRTGAFLGGFLVLVLGAYQTFTQLQRELRGAQVNLQNLQTRLGSLTEEHEDEIERLEREHREEMNQAEDRLRDDLGSTAENRIQALNLSHQNTLMQIETANREREREIEEQTEEFEETIENLEDYTVELRTQLLEAGIVPAEPPEPRD